MGPWQGGEPNNWNGVGEECAEIYYVHSSWNDVPCGQKQYALCNAVGRVVSRTYTKYSNKQCEGTNTDILRDFVGTVAACEAKCDELNCIGFIRVQSTGRCYFRGGEMNRPYDYTSDERDCYIPDTPSKPIDEVDSILFDGGDESFDAAPGFKIADIPITDRMTFSMDITINSLYNRPEGGDQNAVLFECKNKADTHGWVRLPRIALNAVDSEHVGFQVIFGNWANRMPETAIVKVGQPIRLELVVTQSTLTVFQGEHRIGMDINGHDIADSASCYLGPAWTKGTVADVTVSNLVISAPRQDAGFASKVYMDNMDEDVECSAHSDCPLDAPFCYENRCDQCSECHYCHDGVDGTCGNCGAGFPTREDKQYGQEDVMTEDEMEMEEELFEAKMAQEEKEQLGFPTIKGSSAKSAISETADNLECAAHSDCESNLPFCYDGECAPCSECHYCHDGIDGTCGECGRGYPTVEDRSTYVGQYTKSWREFYACEYEDMTSEEIVIDALRKGGMLEIDIAKVTQNKGLSANSYSAKTVNSKAMDDEFIAAENAKEKENSYSAKSLISKAMGDDMSEYRKIIQQELDEEGDSEIEEEMESQLKVIAQLANEETSSAKALGDSKSKYRDVSST